MLVIVDKLGDASNSDRLVLAHEAMSELEELRAANARLRALAGELRVKRYRAVRSPHVPVAWNVLDTEKAALVRDSDGTQARSYSTKDEALAQANRWSCTCACAVSKPRTCGDINNGDVQDVFCGERPDGDKG